MLGVWSGNIWNYPVFEFGMMRRNMSLSHGPCLKSEVANFLCKEHSRLCRAYSLYLNFS